jgi:hypothetical protein
MPAFLGFGFYAGVPNWALPYTRPAWQLLMDPNEHNPFGHDQVIGRVPAAAGGDAWEYEFVKRGIEGGEQYGQYCLRWWEKAAWIRLWVGPNEPPADTTEHARLLSLFYTGFAGFAHRHGRQVLGGSFSRGRPDETTLEAYVPMAQACDGLAFHEYGLGDMRTPQDLTWHCFRYRRLTDLLTAKGIVRPVWITELGLDDDRGGGWRTYGVAPADYLAQLRWYAVEAAKDPQVQGLIVFAASSYGFGSFLVDEEIARGCQAINDELRPLEPVPGPKPQPLPVPAQPGDVLFPKLAWPVLDAQRRPIGRITQGFGERPEYYRQWNQADGTPYRGHNGVDIALAGYDVRNPPSLVTPIPGEALPYKDASYGNTVEIWYPSRARPVLKVIFAHMLRPSYHKLGDKVSAGMVVGQMGSTGNSTGPHLHFGVKPLRGRAINPGFNGWTDPMFYLEAIS